MLWWAYFDFYALVAERRFREAVGVEQVRIARDSYALLHFLMIAGIVLFALGVKKVLEHPEDPLKDMPAVALCGGLALYALGAVAVRLRSTGTVAPARIVTAAVCLALVPVATEVAGLVALPLLAAVWIALIAFETLRYHELRARVRSEHAAH
jgi:low temperature requirement protein LtrA